VNSTISADLWSIDHDYNPGKEYDHPDTIFSKISWDGDQNVKTAGKAILLLTEQPPISAANITLFVDKNTFTASGQVSGLDPDQYSKHKVLVYLKTDQFYIQPVLGGSAPIETTGPGRWPNSRLSMAHQL